MKLFSDFSSRHLHMANHHRFSRHFNSSSMRNLFKQAGLGGLLAMIQYQPKTRSFLPDNFPASNFETGTTKVAHQPEPITSGQSNTGPGQVIVAEALKHVGNDNSSGMYTKTQRAWCSEFATHICNKVMGKAPWQDSYDGDSAKIKKWAEKNDKWLAVGSVQNPSAQIKPGDLIILTLSPEKNRITIIAVLWKKLKMAESIQLRGMLVTRL